MRLESSVALLGGKGVVEMSAVMRMEMHLWLVRNGFQFEEVAILTLDPE